MNSDFSNYLQELLDYYERDKYSQICLISYNQHKNWHDYINLFIKNGLINISNENPDLIICSGCGDIKKLENKEQQLFYRCFECNNIEWLSVEESIVYETNLYKISDFMRGKLNITVPQKNILDERLINLGKHKFETGQFVCYLFRGASDLWEDSAKIISLCAPVDAVYGSLIFFLNNTPPTMPKNRMVAISLAEIISESFDNLIIDCGIIESHLIFAYKGCSGELRKLNEQQFSIWLKKEIETRKIKQGEKSIAIEQAKILFGIGRDTAQKIWQKTVPSEYSTKGRKSKKHTE